MNPFFYIIFRIHRLQWCVRWCWRHAETRHHEPWIYVGRAPDACRPACSDLRSAGRVDGDGHRTHFPRNYFPRPTIPRRLDAEDGIKKGFIAESFFSPNNLST